MSGPLLDRIKSLAIEHPDWGATQIYNFLKAQPAHNPDIRDEDRMSRSGTKIALVPLPDISTVRRVVREARPLDTSGRWSWEDWKDEDPEKTRLVLETLAVVLDATNGAVGRAFPFTRDQAEQIARIRLVVPDLDPHSAWVAAMFYLSRRDRGEETVDLDLFLAFGPWRDPGSWERYETAFRDKFVPRAPSTLLMGTALSAYRNSEEKQRTVSERILDFAREELDDQKESSSG